MIRNALALLVAFAWCSCSTGPAFPDDGSPIVYESQPPEIEPYRIAPGDGLSITFAFHPERNTDVTVRPDGKFSLSLVKEVHAAGKTTAELDAELTKALATQLKAPQLAVNVKTFATQRVFVGGEVGRPGTVDLDSGLTALRALTAAGGLTSTAASDSLLLIRAAGPGKRIVKRLDLSKENLAKNDILLRPFDIVYAPRSSVSQVGLWVDQNINSVIPRIFSFGAFYDLNNLNLK